MAQAFHIVSVERTLTNWGHHHITAVGTDPKPGAPDNWPIASVLGAIASGEIFYTITGLGDPAFARPYRCICGFETIRTTPSGESKDGLEGISADEWQEQGSTPAPF